MTSDAQTAPSEARAERSRDQPGEAASVDFALIRRRLERAVARVCPSWLSSRADDIVQEALVRAAKATERSGHAPNARYLAKVAYSATIDEIRRARRHRVAESEGLEPADESASASPERATHDAQMRLALRECLDGLVDSRRRAVTLYLLGHSVGEVAELIGGNYKRSENLVFRGMADLRDCLSEKGFSR